MNIKNLPLKFAFLAALVLVSIYAVYANGVKWGIDIRGGHSLVYEIKSNAPEIADLESQIKAKESEKATAAPAEIEAIDKQVKELQGRLSDIRKSDEDPRDLVKQIIGVLKKRIDPNGLMNLEWVPMGKTRFEVRMPAAQKGTEAAKNAYLDVLTKMEDQNLQASRISLALDAPADQRSQRIAALAGSDAELAASLNELAAKRDAMNTLSAQIDVLDAQVRTASTTQANDIQKRQDALRDKLEDAKGYYDDGLKEILSNRNVNVARLESILKLYVSQSELKALGKNEIRSRTETYDTNIKKFLAEHPARQGEIEQAIVLYRSWVNNRQGLDDPSDLKRLIAKAGVLEFRIAPLRGDNSVDPLKYQELEQTLMSKGPESLNRLNGRLMWFPMRGDRGGYGNLYTAEYGGNTYMLLYNTPDNTMLQRGGQNWALDVAFQESDDRGMPAVGFKFNVRGAKVFQNLTATHLQQPMAILLDDEVYSAPNINSAISERGQITGSFTQAETAELVRILNAGSLPAKLNPTPVSESTFGPALGEQNLQSALKAGIGSLIVIGIFMLIYYLLSGSVADFAMVLNLVFVLGAMSLLNAVFTLPGVAGLILSIGMAVDANVLIHERLREEQARGNSLRMALKVAYDRAFRAIFDTHITTLITCLILGWVGSEEVRGFAIALGLGVAFNLFTSVTVTRWIFQGMLSTGLVKDHFRMLRLIGVPKIDWMAKRYYFWAFSLATGILGLVAFLVEGKNLLGIEFSSGTQAIVRFNDDAVLKTPDGKDVLPNDGTVQKLIRDTAEKLMHEAAQAKNEADRAGYEKIMAGRPERLIDPSHAANFLKEHFNGLQGDVVTRDDWKKANLNEQMFDLLDTGKAGKLTKKELEDRLPSSAYKLTTTESDVPRIRKVVREAFGSNLNIRLKETFDWVTGASNPIGVPLAASHMTRIDRKLINSARVGGTELADYEGGVLMVIRDVNPPMTSAELAQRIRLMRVQPDQQDQTLKPTSVLGLVSAGPDKFSGFAVMVKPNESFGGEQAAWDQFARNEAEVLSEALSREEALEATNFDAALAGESSGRALFAIILGWLAIILYLWLRFGTAKWGFAAVICLVHDVVIVLGLVAIANWLWDTPVGRALMLEPFKIDMTMVAALLTIIGYSVNDTIVVFDRIRENRGKLQAVTPAIINASVNQTLSRTLLTSITVFVVVFIMYVWGGSGIHSFNYALLIGVAFGTYSSIAVAAPILLGYKGMVFRSLDSQTYGAPAGK